MYFPPNPSPSIAYLATSNSTFLLSTLMKPKGETSYLFLACPLSQSFCHLSLRLHKTIMSSSSIKYTFHELTETYTKNRLLWNCAEWDKMTEGRKEEKERK